MRNADKPLGLPKTVIPDISAMTLEDKAKDVVEVMEISGDLWKENLKLPILKRLELYHEYRGLSDPSDSDWSDWVEFCKTISKNPHAKTDVDDSYGSSSDKP